MNLKFKGTLVILSLMLLASFILAKRQEVKNNSDQIKSDLPTQHSSVFTQIENNKIICVKKSKSIQVQPFVQKIELLHEGLNAELPLPELMQQTGFQIKIDTNSVAFSD